MSRVPKRLFLAALLCFSGLLLHSVPAEPIRISTELKTGSWEAKAAQDLGKYITQLTGQATTIEATSAVPKLSALNFVVGELALRTRPQLRQQLDRVKKKNPYLRSDAVVSFREGQTIYLAGSNDDSHYFAVSKFLHEQGCRWYMPNDFGECIPKRTSLDLSQVGKTYATPFEVRRFWLAWNGDQTGHKEFAHRNFFNQDNSLNPTHELGNLINKEKILDRYQFGSKGFIEALAQKLSPQHAKSQNLSFGMSDAVQKIKSDRLLQLTGHLEDKFFNTKVNTDLYLNFYNDLCSELWKTNPHSRSRASFLAYINLTLPPQRFIEVAEPLICFLAPIDIDPNHSFEDRLSPERRDYLGAVQGWSEVMKKRVIIYDYDQGMLVWRDLPNPSHHVFQKDVRTYQKLGIMGFSTESRGALATTFTNTFFRGQLMWDPDFDVDRELRLFYQNFYGPLAPDLSAYWSEIYRIWQSTTTVFHEAIAIPDIYRRPSIDRLGSHLARAKSRSTELTPVQLKRLKFTELSFQLIDLYNRMERAAARDGDYATAVSAGRQALAAREVLTAMSPTFTTYKKYPEKGPAWWPGEVDYYAKLASLIDGSQGKLVKRLDLEWRFRTDPKDVGVWRQWANTREFAQWKVLRTDHTTRAQGLYDQEGYSPDGYAWYANSIQLTKSDVQGQIHLMFPGIFNESWLYINGKLVEWRKQKPLWWQNDYSFQWDVDLEGKLEPGVNSVFVRTRINQNPSGIFRRPFLYRKK